MRFADKLFLVMTALLTVMFAVFGTWMLSSDFSQLLNKEIEQGNNDSRTFLFLFEMGYQSTEEYGEDYAISRTLNSIAGSVERDGRHMFVIREDGTRFYGGEYLENMGFMEEVEGLIANLETSDDADGSIRNMGIRQIEGSYYMFAITKSGVSDNDVYLGMCRELTDTYSARGASVPAVRWRGQHLFPVPLYHEADPQPGKAGQQDCRRGLYFALPEQKRR